MKVNAAPPALPATQWLGYGLDMTTLAPFGIDVVRRTSLQPPEEPYAFN